MRPAVLAAAATLTLVAACSGSSGDSPEVESATPATTGTGPESPGPVASDPDLVDPPPPAVPDGPPIVDGVANGLIVVHDQDGGARGLASYRADGTRVATYTTEPDTVVWQPIWSPDGRRVAWTTSADGQAWDLVTAAVDGSDRTSHPLPGRPDYITYDPTSSRVLALTPSPQGFGLVIVEVGEGDADQTFNVIDVGQPYFSDFSPSGDRVVAHVATDLRVVDLAGGRQPLDAVSIGHQTPAWHPSDDVVFFATESVDGNRLLSRRLATGDDTELATFDAFVFFDVDPTVARVAVSAFAAVDEDDGDLQAARGAARQTPANALGAGVWIVDLADATANRVSDRPATAPMWDPTGSRFLVRSTIDGIGRWDVYDVEGSRTGTEDFDVGASLLPAYLPFWDQYARSQTLWSPDGEQFVHVGRAADGRSGVWIHDATTAGPSTFLADGDLAFWSPT